MKKLLFILFIAILGSILAHAETFSDYNSLRKFVNTQGDLVVIGTYQRLNPSRYAIVDKKSKTLYVLDENENRLATEKIITYSGDELDRGGSGIYTFAGQKEGVYYGRAERDGSVHALFKGEGPLEKGMTLYVVPETTKHRFRIRNHRITFNARDVIKNLPEYNYSPRNLEVKQSRFTVDRTDEFSKRYVRALQDEKPRLMEIYRLENDEYNMLAEFAYGVLAPETNYGRNAKYRFKETFPYIPSILKGNGFDTSENSRGPTQIKEIPELIAAHYRIEKHELYIPEKAAIATLGKSAEFLTEIRNRATQHPGINEETLQNYMYYLYQGRKSEIVNKSATPYFNIKSNQIREAIKSFHIEE